MAPRKISALWSIGVRSPHISKTLIRVGGHSKSSNIEQKSKPDYRKATPFTDDVSDIAKSKPSLLRKVIYNACQSANNLGVS